MTLLVILLLLSGAANLVLLKMLLFKDTQAEEMIRIYKTLHGDLELSKVIDTLSTAIKKLGAEVFGFYRANSGNKQFEGESHNIPMFERSSFSKAFFHYKPQRLEIFKGRDNEVLKKHNEKSLFVVPVQMQAEKSCWEANNCTDKKCACHSKFKKPCWKDAGLHYRGTKVNTYEEKAEKCLGCKAFMPVGFFVIKANKPSRIFNFLDSNFKGLIKDSIMYEKAFTASTLDLMTGVFNKMTFMGKIEENFKLAKRNLHQLSLVMLDIDHFKNINDTYGHQTGDFILIEMVKIIKTNVRGIDILARYGGEEFAIILTNTGRKEALIACEKVRKKIEETQFVSPDHGELRITISIGLASALEDDTLNHEELIANADGALYYAKENGRNMCVAYDKDNPAMQKKKES